MAHKLTTALMAALLMTGCGTMPAMAPMAYQPAPTAVQAKKQALVVVVTRLSAKGIQATHPGTGENYDLSFTKDTKLIVGGKPATPAQFKKGARVQLGIAHAMFLDMDNLWVGQASSVTLLP